MTLPRPTKILRTEAADRRIAVNTVVACPDHEPKFGARLRLLRRARSVTVGTGLIEIESVLHVPNLSRDRGRTAR